MPEQRTRGMVKSQMLLRETKDGQLWRAIIAHILSEYSTEKNKKSLNNHLLIFLGFQ